MLNQNKIFKALPFMFALAVIGGGNASANNELGFTCDGKSLEKYSPDSDLLAFRLYDGLYYQYLFDGTMGFLITDNDDLQWRPANGQCYVVIKGIEKFNQFLLTNPGFIKLFEGKCSYIGIDGNINFKGNEEILNCYKKLLSRQGYLETTLPEQREVLVKMGGVSSEEIKEQEKSFYWITFNDKYHDAWSEDVQSREYKEVKPISYWRRNEDVFDVDPLLKSIMEAISHYPTCVCHDINTYRYHVKGYLRQENHSEYISDEKFNELLDAVYGAFASVRCRCFDSDKESKVYNYLSSNKFLMSLSKVWPLKLSKECSDFVKSLKEMKNPILILGDQCTERFRTNKFDNCIFVDACHEYRNFAGTYSVPEKLSKKNFYLFQGSTEEFLDFIKTTKPNLGFSIVWDDWNTLDSLKFLDCCWIMACGENTYCKGEGDEFCTEDLYNHPDLVFFSNVSWKKGLGSSVLTSNEKNELKNNLELHSRMTKAEANVRAQAEHTDRLEKYRPSEWGARMGRYGN